MMATLVWPACAPAQSSSSANPASSASSEDGAWQQVVEAAKREGSVLVYGSVLQGAGGTDIAEEFEKATGVTIDVVEAASGAPLAQRIRTEVEAGEPTADIFSGGSIFVHQVKREGFFTPIKDQPLPIFKEPATVWRLHPLAMSADGDIQIFRTSGQYEGDIVVNTNLLPDADHPKSYHELSIDPKYKGKIAYVDPKIPRGRGALRGLWVRRQHLAAARFLVALQQPVNASLPWPERSGRRRGARRGGDRHPAQYGHAGAAR